MTHKEKAEMLKNTIQYLFEKEGRTKTYIAKVLEINEKVLYKKIDEWGFIKADKKHLTPSKEKFLNKHKKEIIDMLDTDIPLVDIANKFNISTDSLRNTYIKNDKELSHHHRLWADRRENRIQENKNKQMENSSRNYIENYNDENWKPILGFEQYEVSNYGRIRKFANRFHHYYEIKPSKNIISGRYYVRLTNNNGISKNLILARIVAHAFCNGYSTENNTVDHKDGNFLNNKADNLEWVSQKENNIRAINNGKKIPKAYQKNGKFKKIIYDKIYEFKTIKAFAKFLGVSETQAARYISGETFINKSIELIY